MHPAARAAEDPGKTEKKAGSGDDRGYEEGVDYARFPHGLRIHETPIARREPFVYADFSSFRGLRMAGSRILIVRLPCHKVFPTGPVYLMSAIRRAAPGVAQQVLDLALLDRGRQAGALMQAIESFRPDVIAFSWRDMQIFSPQYLDGAMRDAFTFFYDSSPAHKLRAAFRGLRDIVTYRSSIAHNLALVRKTTAANPRVTIALGGPSIRIFGDRLRGRLPKRVHTFTETCLDGFFDLIGLAMPPDPIEPEIELEAVEESFPQWEAYRDEVVGVQTKQGCPHACLFCLYGFLEGKTVRRREPARVVREIEGYARRWGSRRFWFVDAQLLSEPRDREHLREILEGIVKMDLPIQWSGYVRIHEIDGSLASLMVRSGLCDLEVSLNSGAQAVLDELKLGFSVEEVLKGFEVLKASGYAGKVLVNLSLNAPGETAETLLQTMEILRHIRRIFGEGRVVPVVFFLAIQPHTGLERKAQANGHIKVGYDPLSVLPWNVIKLIYNPAPLGRLIGRSCAAAFDRGGDDVGETILESIETALKADAPRGMALRRNRPLKGGADGDRASCFQ